MWHCMLSDIVFVVRLSYLDCVYSVNHWTIVLKRCRLASHELKHCPMEKVFLVAHLEPVLLVSFFGVLSLVNLPEVLNNRNPTVRMVCLRQFIRFFSWPNFVNAVEIDCLTVFQSSVLLVEFLQVHPTKQHEYSIIYSSRDDDFQGFCVFAVRSLDEEALILSTVLGDESCCDPSTLCPERTDRSDNNLWDAVDVLGKPDTRNCFVCRVWKHDNVTSISKKLLWRWCLRPHWQNCKISAWYFSLDDSQGSGVLPVHCWCGTWRCMGYQNRWKFQKMLNLNMSKSAMRLWN